MRITCLTTLLLLVTFLSSAGFASDTPPEGDDKVVSGMSIVGNDEAPKSLVIVPWKSSNLGDTLDVSDLLDGGRDPVDRDVFRRALDYYEIRTGTEQ